MRQIDHQPNWDFELMLKVSRANKPDNGMQMRFKLKKFSWRCVLRLQRRNGR